ncbi:Uncharacterised protein [Bordetella bronchiseptica]|nr:Uncharacterised protein [Bordetella bronchiseptica]
MQKISYRASPAERRARAYPPIGDQLDAVMKLAAALQAAGMQLPDDVTRWVEQCQAIKRKYPKPEATNQPA